MSEAVNKIKDYVFVENQAPKHTRSFVYHSTFPNDNKQKEDVKISIKQLKKTQRHYNPETQQFDTVETDEEMIFDIENITPAMANALRRIMISEVPTMAIHQVVVNRNTSIIKDELLAHRLGLIPILADPDKFRFKSDEVIPTLFEEQAAPNKVIHNPNIPSVLYDTETILFQLKVKCKRVNGKIINSHVFSKDLEWVPFGNQSEIFRDAPIRPVQDDILIAKLAPGQEIDLELYCQKGIGKDHAKWSPVSTASYHLLPQIEFTKDIRGENAEILVKKCPMNVFDIEDDTAIIANPRQCSMCRECIRDESWENKIKLYTKKNHFVFTIESTGILKPVQIFKQSLKILYTKAYNQLKELETVEKLEFEEENNVVTFK